MTSRRPELSELIEEALPPLAAPPSLYEWAAAPAHAAAAAPSGMPNDGEARPTARPVPRVAGWRRRLYAAGLLLAAAVGSSGQRLVHTAFRAAFMAG